MPELNGIAVPFVPPGGAATLRQPARPPLPSGPDAPAFRDLFEAEVAKLRFSAHAQTRLDSREIPLSASDIQALENAVNKAGAKGARDSLLLYNDMAFIVNVPNRTVVTALHSDQLKENVFTNIDSAILVEKS